MLYVQKLVDAQSRINGAAFSINKAVDEVNGGKGGFDPEHADVYHVKNCVADAITDLLDAMHVLNTLSGTGEIRMQLRGGRQKKRTNATRMERRGKSPAETSRGRKRGDGPIRRSS